MGPVHLSDVYIKPVRRSTKHDTKHNFPLALGLLLITDTWVYPYNTHSNLLLLSDSVYGLNIKPPRLGRLGLLVLPEPEEILVLLLTRLSTSYGTD